MFKIIAVTNLPNSNDYPLNHLQKLLNSGIDALILRAKDLPDSNYLQLAKQVQLLSYPSNVTIILHNFSNYCQLLDNYHLHLAYQKLPAPLPLLKKLQLLGVSIHSIEEAKNAASLGADYLLAGHIFPTACKSGLPARGLSFLEAICNTVTIPVYAIGGITPSNIRQIQKSGASGACLMSSFMNTPNPAALAKKLRQNLRTE